MPKQPNEMTMAELVRAYDKVMSDLAQHTYLVNILEGDREVLRKAILARGRDAEASMASSSDGTSRSSSVRSVGSKSIMNGTAREQTTSHAIAAAIEVVRSFGTATRTDVATALKIGADVAGLRLNRAVAQGLLVREARGRLSVPTSAGNIDDASASAALRGEDEKPQGPPLHPLPDLEDGW